MDPKDRRIVEDIKSHVDLVIDNLRSEIRSLAESVAANGRKLDWIEGRPDRVDIRLDRIEACIDRIERRLDRLEAKAGDFLSVQRAS